MCPRIFICLSICPSVGPSVRPVGGRSYDLKVEAEVPVSHGWKAYRVRKEKLVRRRAGGTEEEEEEKNAAVGRDL